MPKGSTTGRRSSRRRRRPWPRRPKRSATGRLAACRTTCAGRSRPGVRPRPAASSLFGEPSLWSSAFVRDAQFAAAAVAERPRDRAATDTREPGRGRCPGRPRDGHGRLPGVGHRRAVPRLRRRQGPGLPARTQPGRPGRGGPRRGRRDRRRSRRPGRRRAPPERTRVHPHRLPEASRRDLPASPRCPLPGRPPDLADPVLRRRSRAAHRPGHWPGTARSSIQPHSCRWAACRSRSTRNNSPPRSCYPTATPSASSATTDRAGSSSIARAGDSAVAAGVVPAPRRRATSSMRRPHGLHGARRRGQADRPR